MLTVNLAKKTIATIHMEIVWMSLDIC